MSTSASRTRLRSTAWPRASVRFSVMERLPRAYTFHHSSPRSRSQVRSGSPPRGFSTLTTSAPWSASTVASTPPAMRREQSTTRSPSSARAIASNYDTVMRGRGVFTGQRSARLSPRPLRHRRRHDVHQVGGLERLREIAERSMFQCRREETHVLDSREHHDRDRGVELVHLLLSPNAVHPRHVDVEQNHVGPLAAELREPFDAIRGRDGAVARGQVLVDQLRDRRFVIHDQHQRFHAVASPPSSPATRRRLAGRRRVYARPFKSRTCDDRGAWPRLSSRPSSSTPPPLASSTCTWTPRSTLLPRGRRRWWLAAWEAPSAPTTVSSWGARSTWCPTGSSCSPGAPCTGRRTTSTPS